MSEIFNYSVFKDILFPETGNRNDGSEKNLMLQKTIRFTPSSSLEIFPGSQFPASFVIFDFETTGLDANIDQIIEIGAQRIDDFKITSEFNTLINPGLKFVETTTKLTGINEDMIKNQPTIKEILPDFLNFIKGALLVAHNAEFDMGFLRVACLNSGYMIDWPCFCTLKLARSFLSGLESKNLNALAKHYGLEFESRHRALGDVKVTTDVLINMLKKEANGLKTWKDLTPFRVKNENIKSIKR